MPKNRDRTTRLTFAAEREWSSKHVAKCLSVDPRFVVAEWIVVEFPRYLIVKVITIDTFCRPSFRDS
jgi:hypothetical protein